MNLISDTKGRRISTIISLAITVIGVACTFLSNAIVAFLGGLLKVIPLLFVSQFCGGFGAYAIVTLSYTLLSDFCSDSFRPKAVVIVNSAWYFFGLCKGFLDCSLGNRLPSLNQLDAFPSVHGVDTFDHCGSHHGQVYQGVSIHPHEPEQKI